VYSARFAQRAGGQKSDAANNQHLTALLQGQGDRSASYVAVLVYVNAADDPRPIIAEGTWNGQIIDTPRGDQGFGYDPHFYLPELGKTVAELAPADKNALSHRARALKQLVQALRSRLQLS
jgi:XTP/dITP diphosphohydrolase